jgi:hypothetical protein
MILITNLSTTLTIIFKGIIIKKIVTRLPIIGIGFQCYHLVMQRLASLKLPQGCKTQATNTPKGAERKSHYEIVPASRMAQCLAA